MNVPARWTLKYTSFYLNQTDRLPEEVVEKLKKTHEFLEQDPHHPSLRTHKVRGALTPGGKPVFESYVTARYRLTFHYEEGRRLVLRNVDDHDACLNRP